MVICLEQDADLHMVGHMWAIVQLMPLPITVSCFSKIQIGFTFLVPAHPGSPGQRAVKRMCMCVCVCVFTSFWSDLFFFCSIWTPSSDVPYAVDCAAGSFSAIQSFSSSTSRRNWCSRFVRSSLARRSINGSSIFANLPTSHNTYV